MLRLRHSVSEVALNEAARIMIYMVDSLRDRFDELFERAPDEKVTGMKRSFEYAMGSLQQVSTTFLRRSWIDRTIQPVVRFWILC